MNIEKVKTVPWPTDDTTKLMSGEIKRQYHMILTFECKQIKKLLLWRNISIQNITQMERKVKLNSLILKMKQARLYGIFTDHSIHPNEN